MTLLWLLILALLGNFTAAPAEVVPAPGAAPAANGHALTLTISNRACPVAYAGANYAQDCQEPIANMEFAITAPAAQAQTLTTDPTGAVTFADLPAATYEVTGGPPGEFVQNAITCRLTDGKTGAVPFFPRDNRAIGVTLTDTAVICHWFSVPEDLRGDG
ncbi:MAG: prealbumin-like fold domain-containing protein [Chloroflexia bacterium]|nr:prealbumin-like fold domain-containing protein [Chloroflexia bacterium]